VFNIKIEMKKSELFFKKIKICVVYLQRERREKGIYLL